jgi:hypothetical protein
VNMTTNFRFPEKAGSFSTSWSRKKPSRGVGLHIDLSFTLRSFRSEVPAWRTSASHTCGGAQTFIAAWVSNPWCNAMRAVFQNHTKPSSL